MSIENVSGVRADIAQMLERIRDVSNKSGAFKVDDLAHQSGEFNGVMQSASKILDSVNNSQNQSDALKDQYLKGDPNVSLAQVVLSSEKSKMAFEGLIIVRNKCLDSYKEIMNMPV
tara:strand:+ start:1616 stop:1963 length:348 start_codon:yes stop_codon:yes gene_type:complete